MREDAETPLRLLVLPFQTTHGASNLIANVFKRHVYFLSGRHQDGNRCCFSRIMRKCRCSLDTLHTCSDCQRMPVCYLSTFTFKPLSYQSSQLISSEESSKHVDWLPLCWLDSSIITLYWFNCMTHIGHFTHILCITLPSSQSAAIPDNITLNFPQSFLCIMCPWMKLCKLQDKAKVTYYFVELGSCWLEVKANG